MEELIRAFQKVAGSGSPWRIKKISKPKRARGPAEKIIIYLWPWPWWFFALTRITIVSPASGQYSPRLRIVGPSVFVGNGGTIRFTIADDKRRVYVKSNTLILFEISCQVVTWCSGGEDRYNLVVQRYVEKD